MVASDVTLPLIPFGLTLVALLGAAFVLRRPRRDVP